MAEGSAGGRRRRRAEERAEPPDPAGIMAAAAALLAARPMTVMEMRRRLTARRYPADVVEAALLRLQQARYLDDRAFAVAWVASRDRSRPRGSAALRRELLTRGVAREIVDEVLAGRREPAPVAGSAPGPGSGEGGGTDEAAARSLLDRRAASLAQEGDPRKRRAKAWGLLVRNGFDPALAGRLAVEAARATGEAADDEAPEGDW